MSGISWGVGTRGGAIIIWTPAAALAKSGLGAVAGIAAGNFCGLIKLGFIFLRSNEYSKPKTA